MKILNIHGFQSHGENSKKKWLEKLFPECEIVSPTLSPIPSAAQKLLGSLLREGGYRMIVGSSLGGFYAWYFSQVRSTPSILLNPALNPFYDLIPRLGHGVNPETKINYYFGDEDLNHLTRMFARVYPADYERFKIYLAGDDEVLDYSQTKKVYEDKITLGPFGGHRFKNVDLISEEVKEFFRKKCL